MLGPPRRAFADLDGNNLRPALDRNNNSRSHLNRLREGPYQYPVPSEIVSGPDGTVLGRKPPALSETGSGTIQQSSPDISKLERVCPFGRCTQNIALLSEQEKDEHYAMHEMGSLAEGDFNQIMHTLGVPDAPPGVAFFAVRLSFLLHV